jgi:DME family drug/metabolite transporter
LGLVLTLGAGLAFNAALTVLPASVVSIVATIEPVIAMLLGRLLLGEIVGWPQALGAALIVAAVVLLQRQASASQELAAATIHRDR